MASAPPARHPADAPAPRLPPGGPGGGPLDWARRNLFGSWASTAVTLVMAYLLLYKILDFRRDLVSEHGPLMVMGAILLLAGLMLFSTGLLGEVMIRTYFESQGRRIYAVREVRARKDGVPHDSSR